MSLPEYTVRIVSHQRDRASRRELIAEICGHKCAENNSPATETRIMYEGIAFVNIVESDYNDEIERIMTDRDVMFVSFWDASLNYTEESTYVETGRGGHIIKTYVNSYAGMDEQSDYKRQWVEKTAKITRATWWECSPRMAVPRYSDMQIVGNRPVPTPSNFAPGSTKIVRSGNTSNAKALWWEFIRDKFGIFGLQSTDYAFIPANMQHEPACPPPAPPVSATASNDTEPPAGVDIPWPIPEMTISLPKFVLVDSIHHSPRSGNITIKFK